MDGESSSDMPHRHTHNHDGGSGWGWGWMVGLLVIILLVVFFVWWAWSGNNNNNNCCPPPSCCPVVVVPPAAPIGALIAGAGIPLNSIATITGTNLQRVYRLTVFDSAFAPSGRVYEVENFVVNAAGTSLTFYAQHALVTGDLVYLYYDHYVSPATVTAS